MVKDLQQGCANQFQFNSNNSFVCLYVFFSHSIMSDSWRLLEHIPPVFFGKVFQK